MVNVAVIQGRIVAEPELKHTNSDIPVCTFTLANDTGYGDKKKTSFIDIVCWRNTAEFAAKHFRKGMLVAVEGSIQTRSYEDKQGNKRKAFEVVANNVHFAEPKREGGQNQGQSVPAADNGDFVEIEGDEDLPF